MARVDEYVARGLAALSIGSSRHAKAVIAVILLLTGVFGYGVGQITTNVDVADVLPRGNPNTEAAHELTEKFRSTFTQQVTLQLHVDESQGQVHWAKDNARLVNRNVGLTSVDSGDGAGRGRLTPQPNNITDEVYVRATAELVEFIQASTDFERTISISNIYALLNWTIAGGAGSEMPPQEPAPESAFALPGYATQQEATQYVLVDQAVKAAVLDTVDAISSPSWNHAAALFMPAADNKLPTPELGRQMLAARDAYVQAVADGKTEFTVFGPDNPPLFTVDLPIANAHSSALVREDLGRIMPFVAAFILACLYIAFRNVRAVTVGFSTLIVGVVWSYGTMGYLGIALNTLNMTIVPLVMGVGIDYAIHMINEYVEHRSRGMSDEEAFRMSGQRSGLAMLIATATTIGGLAVLIWSPSLLIAELGIIAVVALASIYLLAIIFIPAALTLFGRNATVTRFRPSRIMPALGRGVTKFRWAFVVAVLVVSVLAYPIATNIHKEAFGDPGRNYLPSDPIRQEHEKGLAWFYEAPDSDEKANILTFSGSDILTPEAIAYYRAIEANLKEQPRVIPDTLRTVPFFIETWLTVKGGPTGAVRQIVEDQVLNPPELPDLPLPPGVLPPTELPGPVQDEVESFPATEEEIKAEVNAMFDSPMRELSSIIINHPANDMAAMTFSVRAATYPQAEQVWNQVWKAVGDANKTFGGHPPGDIKVAFVGNTATNYLFIAKELPWLQYMNIVGNIVLVILVFLMTRSVKITLVTLILSTLTSLWWLAILPTFGIGMAITLTLPFAFIIAIGTDYGIHFMWNIKQTGNPREVFESTGKAVLFGALTTTGAFAFFIALQNVAVSRTMVATTLSFGVIFLATLVIVPIFFGVPRKPKALNAGAATAGPGHGAPRPAASRPAPKKA